MPRSPMRYFLALFCSPLACLLAPSFGAAILNAFLYFGSFWGWLFFAWPGMLLWFLGVLHAWAVIGTAKADRRMERMMRATEQQRKAF